MSATGIVAVYGPVSPAVPTGLPGVATIWPGVMTKQPGCDEHGATPPSGVAVASCAHAVGVPTQVEAPPVLHAHPAWVVHIA